jgi:hypothetical protein
LLGAWAHDDGGPHNLHLAISFTESDQVISRDDEGFVLECRPLSATA